MTRFVLAVLLALLAAGASAEDSRDPVVNFEALWTIMDEKYGNFGPKDVDWDHLYRVYRPQVTPDMGDAALYDLMVRMLDHLNDGHVGISNGEEWFGSGSRGVVERSDFSRELVQAKYLTDGFEETLDGLFIYGMLTKRIGYMHFTGFDNPRGSGETTDALLELCGDCDGIVVDVRDNGGGSDMVGRAIAGRFADAKRPYIKTQTKIGPGPEEFTEPRTWYIEPKGDKQFTGPVIVITNGNSASAAEVFTQGMRTLPHVIHIGTTTTGIFADARGDELPNGWEINYAFTRFTDQNDFCWEGIGVVPHLRVTNTEEDMDAERDRAIELAVGLIEAVE